ncbi:MAG: hypothetical protein U0835_10340 [Isosphaeraceae bacterium]
MAEARQKTAELRAEVAGLQGGDRTIGRLTNAAQGLFDASGRASANVAGLAGNLSRLGQSANDANVAREAVVGLQRSAYGASKNLEDAGKNLQALASKSSALGPLNDQLRGVRAGVGSGVSRVKRFGAALDGLATRIAVFQSLKSAIEGVAEAIQSARQTASKGGKKNLQLRDRYRELANLQGRPEPDNAVVGGALRFRLATGLSDDQANDALRRFEGSLPAALKRGNITGSSTSGLAGDFFREAARTGVRVDLSGGSAGLLAAKLAQDRKIGSVDEGLSRFGAVVDTLNRGDGDLTPLIQSLVRGSGGLVGEGTPFRSLEEFAAAQSVASLNASPTVSSTRVRQAVTALNRFGDEDTAATFKKLGITSADDFSTRIEKLSPLLEKAPNKDLALTEAGFGNQAERRALLQFYGNRSLLRSETDAVRKGVDPAATRKLNDQFFASGDAQNRVAQAEVDAAEFAQFQGSEASEVLRKRAEANLRRRLDLDTKSSNITEAFVDNPVTRTLGALRNPLQVYQSGGDTLPLFLGGKSYRDMSIDAEANRISKEQAAKVGIDPIKFRPDLFGPGGGGSPEERADVLSRETRRSGGSPFGGSEGTDALLRQLIRETQSTNQLLEQGNKAAAQPAMLPLRHPPGSLPTSRFGVLQAEDGTPF